MSRVLDLGVMIKVSDLSGMVQDLLGFKVQGKGLRVESFDFWG